MSLEDVFFPFFFYLKRYPIIFLRFETMPYKMCVYLNDLKFHSVWHLCQTLRKHVSYTVDNQTEEKCE